MANAEHLKTLQQGPQAWQDYLVDRQTRNFRANLVGADLVRANLRMADLGRANLGRANLGRADLGRADLGRAYLGRANLGRANLEGADLVGANLEGADLGGANLREAYLREAYLRGANLRDAVFDGSTVWSNRFDPAAAGALDMDVVNSGEEQPEDSEGVESDEQSLREPENLVDSSDVQSNEADDSLGAGRVSVRDVAAVESDRNPSQEDIQLVVANAEKVLGHARTCVDTGVWESRKDYETDVENLIRSMQHEMYSVVDRPTNTSIVQTYAARLSQYLIQVEAKKLFEAGDTEAAENVAEFGEQVLQGLEDPNDINAAYQAADWYADHSTNPPQNDTKPVEQIDSPQLAVAKEVGWIRGAIESTSAPTTVFGPVGLRVRNEPPEENEQSFSCSED